MNSDFYCDEVLSGKTQIFKVMETDTVLAYHHTREQLLYLQTLAITRMKNIFICM